MSAGASAAEEADRQRLLAEAHRRAASEAARLALNYAAAASSEKQTARLLARLAGVGYHLLPDRRWPGTRRANVDMVVVGPGGVFIVDSKNWASPTIAAGRIYRDQEDVTDEFERLEQLADDTEAALGEIGLAPGEVRIIVVFTGNKRIRPGTVGRVEVVGEADLVTQILGRGYRLSPDQVDRVLVKVVEFFPAISAPSPSPAPVVASVPEPVLAPPTPPTEADLPDPDEIDDAILEAMKSKPIEDWMAFLHPDQAKLVRRSFGGPSRIRGAAGTGKTVVGLHRAAYLARSNPEGKVLVTTYVRTLPQVLKNLFARLAPDLVDRVEFTSVHQLASRILSQNGVRLNLNKQRADLLFEKAWAEASAPLIAIEKNKDYWEEEVRHVIKGRGLTTLDQYRDCARVGRNRKLGPNQRADVWKLYTAYDRRLREAGVCDFEDQILRAEQVLREHPLTGYSAVIVDEAQDLSCAMVRMLARIAGDAPDALTLIGDGQQTIYPGGYTLTEAGVSLGNRGVVMETNYRNTAEILEAARSIVAGSSYTDIEGIAAQASAPTAPRRGPKPVFASFPTKVAHNTAMVERVRAATKAIDVSVGDVAVLCFYQYQVDQAVRLFAAAGIPTITLDKYDGTTTDALKIGTIKRSKGLEFKHVLVPWVAPRLKAERRAIGEMDASSEREDRDRRELFVGITRARDQVWVGSVGAK
ncbi:nuclease-related domain-containing DEAD/DEAH box helicase [Gryllotalpicola ginsengisoli]|uniref:nuclease-related domain-containing DEAD/DEAH box helicase n=1 Tax=Gryllotalpicola ginsengisoli TaxID=444608 RepID=UPI0003B6E550|nr:UvrD-helicase domain-containing protein [Gryllotalpicola ginsengisoli]